MKPKIPKKKTASSSRSKRSTGAKSKSGRATASKARRLTPITPAEAATTVARPEAPAAEAPRKRVMRKRTAAKPKAAESAKPKRSGAVKEIARTARKAPSRIPPILLEPDRPEAPAVSGPGQRYALGPSAPVEAFESEGELPEAYGTQYLLLAARDPHWLYAHWDLTREQQRFYNAQSRDRHLVLRVYLEALEGAPVEELHVHPESTHWFAHVPHAGKRYIAQLGFYELDGDWFTVSTSGATITPPDTASTDTTVEFATIPIEVPMAKLLSLVKEAARESAPLAEAFEQLRREERIDLPSIRQITAPAPSSWTPEQERALAQVISMDEVRRVWMGSLEITELLRRQLVQEMASLQAAGAMPMALPTSPAGAPGAVSSPAPVPGKAERGFWFNVNAELVVYGATEPDARVTIGGRAIRLRPDGTFSYRFALPDGNFELPIVAVSADQTDGRAAQMSFSRQTDYSGEVGAQAQDPSLKPPAAAHL